MRTFKSRRLLIAAAGVALTVALSNMRTVFATEPTSAAESTCVVEATQEAAVTPTTAVTLGARPNIILFLCDDLGYGDISCLNSGGKIRTPHVDRLAREGIVFTDAHSSSSVCTPTRYSLLTGRYNWRSRLKSGVLGGISPALIEPETKTIAHVLKEQGYTTACLGKWHLGLNWQSRNPVEFKDEIEKGEAGWQVDYAQPFERGPTTLGFDYFFGISASLDMVPYTFLENDRVLALPTIDASFPMMLGRKPQQTTRRGPAAADFDADQVLPALTDKAVELLRQWAEGARHDKPFFMYIPFASPHTPIVPTPAWQGASGLNPYADFVMQNDAAVGQILHTLDELHLTDNTLVIFTSDNGCSPQADFAELTQAGHAPSYQFRGHKADIFEGGHRVPFIARWPQGLPAGAQCDALIGLQDTLATCADLLDVDLPATVGVDSFSWLPRVTQGNRNLPIRESLVHHSINGSFAIRRDRWKLCLCADSGGWSNPRPNSPQSQGLPPVQLYDLENDIAESHNLATAHPEVVASLTEELNQLKALGHSFVPDEIQE
jgi:arylsulfatase A-like enzyme